MSNQMHIRTCSCVSQNSNVNNTVQGINIANKKIFGNDNQIGSCLEKNCLKDQFLISPIITLRSDENLQTIRYGRSINKSQESFLCGIQYETNYQTYSPSRFSQDCLARESFVNVEPDTGNIFEKLNKNALLQSHGRILTGFLNEQILIRSVSEYIGFYFDSNDKLSNSIFIEIRKSFAASIVVFNSTLYKFICISC